MFWKSVAPVQERIIKNVPYYSQWESRNLVSKIINKEISAKKDLFWKRSGANNRSEYEFWSKNICGMACLKMIVAHKRKKVIPIIKLGKKCLEYGGYVLKGNDLEGLYYYPFVEFIKKEIELEGHVIPHMSISDIENNLTKGHYVIASVSHKIRDPKTIPTKKGGHLVLMLGFNRKNKTLFFHNPSGFTKKTQEYVSISYDNFNKFFAKRGIIIKN